MGKVHGKSGRVKVETTTFECANEWTLDISGNPEDVTCFEDAENGTDRIGGVEDFKGTIKAWFDDEQLAHDTALKIKVNAKLTLRLYWNKTKNPFVCPSIIESIKHGASTKKGTEVTIGFAQCSSLGPLVYPAPGPETPPETP